MNIQYIILKSRQYLLDERGSMFYFLMSVRYMVSLISIVAIGYFAKQLDYNFVVLTMNYMPLFILLHYSAFQSERHTDRNYRIGFIMLSCTLLLSILFPQFFGLSQMFSSILIAKLFTLPQVLLFIIIPVLRLSNCNRIRQIDYSVI